MSTSSGTLTTVSNIPLLAGKHFANPSSPAPCHCLWLHHLLQANYGQTSVIPKRYLGHLETVVFGLTHFLLGLQVIFAGHCPSALESSFAFFISMNYFVQGTCSCHLSAPNTQRQQSGSKTLQNSFTEWYPSVKFG